MPKKNIIILTFLLLGLFCLFTDKIFALGLEVQYPEISGKTLTAQSELPDFALYLFKAGMFLGFFAAFFSIIIAGIMYFLSPVSAELKANAKDRFTGAISGLLILSLTYLIITTINPQLKFFKTTKLPEPPPVPEETRSSGVYFYSEYECSDKKATPYVSSVSDLGRLKNKINAVDIVQDESASYISILYDNTGLWGRCQYIDPNEGCQLVLEPFAASASVHKFDFEPDGDGVYFFRKSCFNSCPEDKCSYDKKKLVEQCKKNSGGYYKVENSEIKDIFNSPLELLIFNDVPYFEGNCVAYNKNGSCLLYSPFVSLGGEDISSIIINGNYVVLLVYFGLEDLPTGIWSSCQEFPTGDDVNKIGLYQIKWEKIRNNKGLIPNYVLIFPVQ